MYRIAICDDDKRICAYIETVLLAFAKKQNRSLSVEVYFSGEDLTKDMENGHRFDVIFLDIELTNMNGVEVGRQIRECLCDEAVHILYISAKPGYALSLFETRPLNFLVKPLNEEMIEKNLMKSIVLSEREKLCFSFQIGKHFFRIPHNTILYFTSEAKKVRLVTSQESYEFYAKLKDIAEQLPLNEFFFIHKSYLVNYLYVKEYHHDCLILVNGERLIISQAYRRAAKEQLLKIRRERG